MGDKPHSFKNGLIGLGGGLSTLAMGIEQISEYLIKKNAIINSIYANSDKITPETIQQVNDLASKVSIDNMIVGTFSLLVSGRMFHNYYYYSVKKR